MYFKGINEAKSKLSEEKKQVLTTEYRGAEKIGEARLGEKHFFYRPFLSVRYIPYCEICHVFMRVESGECGEFPLHEHYMVLICNGQEHKLRFERPEHIKKLLQSLQEKNPDLLVGFHKNGI